MFCISGHQRWPGFPHPISHLQKRSIPLRRQSELLGFVVEMRRHNGMQRRLRRMGVQRRQNIQWYSQIARVDYTKLTVSIS